MAKAKLDKETIIKAIQSSPEALAMVKAGDLDAALAILHAERKRESVLEEIAGKGAVAAKADVLAAAEAINSPDPTILLSAFIQPKQVMLSLRQHDQSLAINSAADQKLSAKQQVLLDVVTAAVSDYLEAE